MMVGDVVRFAGRGIGVVIAVERVTIAYAACKVAREDGGVYTYSEKWLDEYSKMGRQMKRRNAICAATVAAEALRRIG